MSSQRPTAQQQLGGRDDVLVELKLTHAEAEAVGRSLADYFARLGLAMAPIDPRARVLVEGDLAWADAVQLVLRLARTTLEESRQGTSP